MDFYQRDFLTLLDYTKEEIEALIDLAIKFKKLKSSNVSHKILKGKNVVLVLTKNSTRIRCAFEVASRELGINATCLGPNGTEIGESESIIDTTRTLATMYDSIGFYGINHDKFEELVKYSKVPLWNGLTDRFHPIQVLADFMTIKEHFNGFKNKKLVYCGDGRNNIANSLMIICSKLGIDYICCSPKELWPSDDLFNNCKTLAEANKSKIIFEEDIERATFMADIVYTDSWVSICEDDSLWEERIKLLSPYQINKKVMSGAKNNAIFLHSLPAFHNKDTVIAKQIYEKYGIEEMEVTDEVFESKQSKVFVSTENYVHALKAILCAGLYKGVIK